MTNEITKMKVERVEYDIIDQGAFDRIYPIGSIYISLSASLPSTFKADQWRRVSDGLFLMSASSDMGTTGGQESVTLTTDQIPSHKHTIDVWSMGAGEHTHTISTHREEGGGLKWIPFYEDGQGGWDWMPTNTAGDHQHRISGNTWETGGGQSHENRPPFIKVSMWERYA